jgi:hypothetical protein
MDISCQVRQFCGRYGRQISTPAAPPFKKRGTLKRTKNISQQTIDTLAANFLPSMQAFFRSEEGQKEYQKYIDEKADFAKSAEQDNTDDKDKVANGTHAA